MTLTLALTAILPLIGILVGAGLQYFFGRSLELRKHIQAQKGQAYADYFRAFSQIATQGRTKDALAALTDAKTRVCIYGSSLVVQRLAEFEQGGPATVTPESHERVAILLGAMRLDIGASSKVARNRDIGVVIFGSDWKR
jgi:hypothetical protein